MSYSNPRTTDKYVKVKKQQDKAPENEIRIRAVPRIGRYISYAATLLLGDDKTKKQDFIILKASGNAAKSACQIAEILRHKVLGLHQLNILKTIDVIDEYEPREEGLDKVTVARKLAVLEIHLTSKDGLFDAKAAGYQAPLPKDQVEEEGLKAITENRRRTGGEEGGDRRRTRGNRRGGRGGRGRYAGNRGGRAGGDRRDDRDDRRGDDRRDDRDRRDNRDNRDNRDRRDNRDYNRDNRDNRDRRDNRDNREGGNRDYNRDNRDNREGGNRDYNRDRRDNRDGGNRGGNRGGPRGGNRGGNRGGSRQNERRD